MHRASLAYIHALEPGAGCEDLVISDAVGTRPAFRTLRRRGLVLDFLRDPIWGFVQVLLVVAPFIYVHVRRWTKHRRRKGRPRRRLNASSNQRSGGER